MEFQSIINANRSITIVRTISNIHLFLIGNIEQETFAVFLSFSVFIMFLKDSRTYLAGCGSFNTVTFRPCKETNYTNV